MKILKLAVLMILLAGTAAAQGSSTADAPGVSVLKISWRWVAPGNPRLNDTRTFASPDSAARRAVNTARINENKSARARGIDTPPPVLLEYPASPDPIPAVRPWSGFVYEITVQNNGAKTIRQIVFAYSFTDPRTHVTVGRRQFKSKVKIRPGMTANLVVRSSRPMGTVDATQAGANRPDQSPDQVVIERIKYADGSVCNGPRSRSVLITKTERPVFAPPQSICVNAGACSAGWSSEAMMIDFTVWPVG